MAAEMRWPGTHSPKRGNNAVNNTSSGGTGAMPKLPGPDDIVIAVMGMTGAGKSTFISYFSDTAVTGDSLESCTSTVTIHPARCANTPIYLIDTPGFDDTYRSDTDVLREIVFYLNQSFQSNTKLAGIIYLHRITDNRLTSSALKNLRWFRKLVGDSGLPCVVLATTMWNNLPPKDIPLAEQRERELRTKPEFWRGMIDKGSSVHRIQSTGTSSSSITLADSATQIVTHILRKRQKITLDIQTEMASGKPLSETKIGREVGAELLALERKHREEIEKLRRERDEAIEQRDFESQKEIERERAAAKRRIREVEEDKKKLEANLVQLRDQMVQAGAGLGGAASADGLGAVGWSGGGGGRRFGGRGKKDKERTEKDKKCVVM